jgi:hypothetical protein
LKQTDVIKGKTTSGFAFCIQKRALDNMELVDAIADLSDGNGTKVVTIVRLLLGEDQKKKLYDHVRDEDKIVPQEKISAELTEIFNLCRDDNAIKNSES